MGMHRYTILKFVKIALHTISAQKSLRFLQVEYNFPATGFLDWGAGSL